ncbi:MULTISPECIES: hypothetical protein [Brevibacterium]|uniref:Uncharacterized protein n=1 Tax=Brevibacterium luteolum TaxID=199591 RepID=A0A6G8KZ85_9MICO|nr:MULTISPECIES: hypothetical protein [Brevibacterium]QIN29933.1 hypothetical protein EW640_12095 [Brevibacterium luteolum]
MHRTGGIETGTVASADGHIFHSDAEHDSVLSDELVTYDHPEPESVAMATNAPGELKRHVLCGEFTSLSNCDGTLSVVVSENSIDRDIPRDSYLAFTPDGSGVAAEELPSERISTIGQSAQPC